MKALEQSIEKWKRNSEITDLEQATLGVVSCPLCVEFYDYDDEFEADHCRNCPVSIRTGRIFCRDTPYVDAEDACARDNLEQFIAAAKAEVTFLESLRT